MLRLNLSTRPFYNERLVHAVLGLVTVAAIAFTAYNATRIVTLRQRLAALEQTAEANEAETARLRQEANAVRRGLDQQEIRKVASAAAEANAIIDSRTFSWSELFERFEDTLPPDVRIVSVSPRVERDGRMLIAMIVVSRRPEDVALFVDEMEKTGAFRNVLSSQETVNDEGLLETVLEGQYVRQVAPAAAESE